jgi:hypothetical protein
MRGLAAALAAGMGVMAAATAAPPRPRLAIMPTQYFSADAQSAKLVDNELAYQFGYRGYSVVPMAKSRATFQGMGLQPNRSYSDAVAAKFGRRLGARVVAYPQLLSAALPSVKHAGSAAERDSGAVLFLRVVNAQTGQRLYAREVEAPYPAAAAIAVAGPAVPRSVASALATRTTNFYFQRVAGSREELRSGP